MVTIWSQKVLLKNRALIGTESILEDFAMTLTSDFTPHPWSNKHSLGLVQGRYGKWEEKSAQTKVYYNLDIWHRNLVPVQAHPLPTSTVCEVSAR